MPVAFVFLDDRVVAEERQMVVAALPRLVLGIAVSEQACPFLALSAPLSDREDDLHPEPAEKPSQRGYGFLGGRNGGEDDENDPHHTQAHVATIDTSLVGKLEQHLAGGRVGQYFDRPEQRFDA